jgi:hypothetical protein
MCSPKTSRAETALPTFNVAHLTLEIAGLLLDVRIVNRKKAAKSRFCAHAAQTFSGCQGSAWNAVGVQLTGVYHNLLRRWAERELPSRRSRR